MPLPYAGFLSYRSRTDYARARWIEGFLEGFHTKIDPTIKVQPISIARDGSDFRLPSGRDAEEKHVDVWPIIRAELEKSERLLLLCSPGLIESPWVLREIEWFLQNRAGHILLLVTDAEDPVGAPEQCFPRPILDLRLNEGQIWYDLRGHEYWQTKRKPRNWEDEIVRLASDLLGWDAAANGPLWSVYQREQLHLRRRQALWISIAAGITLILAAAAGWYAIQAARQAQHARANAIVAAAQANPDPLTSALMLLELKGDEPQGGVELARSIASQRLPTAELSGPRSGISDLQFVRGADYVAAVSDDGTLFEWKSSGMGDPLASGRAVGEHPIGFAVADGGGYLAAAVREGKALLWDVNKKATTEISLPGMVESICYVPALGGFVAILEDGRAFRLEDVGKVTRILADAPPIVVLRGISGRGLLIGARNGDVFLADHRQQLTKLPGPPRALLNDFPISGPRDAVFSPDGHWYATSSDHRILLRSLQDGKVFRSLDYSKALESMQFSENSSYLAAGGEGGIALIWNVADGTKLRDLDTNLRFWLSDANGRFSDKEPSANSIEHLEFEPGHSDRLGVLTSDGNIRLWDLAGGDPILFRGHLADHFTWSVDGRVMLSGADVGTVRTWPMDAPGEPRILQHPAQVDQAYFTADGRIISRTRDKTLHEWIGSAREHRTLYEAGTVSTIALDPSRKRIFAGLKNGSIRVDDTIYHPLTREITNLAIANIRALVSAGAELAVQDLLDSAKTTNLPRQPADIESVDASPAGDAFVTADAKGKVLLWTQESGWAAKTLLSGDGVPVFEVRFHPNGRSVVTCSEDGSASLFSLSSDASHRIDLPSQGKWLEMCEFSPDGRWLLITSATGQAWLMDSDGRHPQVLRREAQLAHVGSILAVSFSADSSQVLLVGGVDAEATVWDVRSRKLVTVLSGHRGAITTGLIAPNGSELLTASEDGSIRLWRNGWPDLQHRLRSLTTATLNPEQRMVLLGETETEAWSGYRDAERMYGRSGRSSAFLFPY